MCYFILLIGRGTKYRTRLIITSPACQVRRRPTHLEPALHISTIIPAQNGSYYRPLSRLSVLKTAVDEIWRQIQSGPMLRRSGHQLRKAWQEPKWAIHRIILPRKGRMMINLILSISFMSPFIHWGDQFVTTFATSKVFYYFQKYIKLLCI